MITASCFHRLHKVIRIAHLYSWGNALALGLASSVVSYRCHCFTYIVPIIGIFGGTVVPLYKGMMSQMVDPDERGKRLLFAKKRKERKEKEKKGFTFPFFSPTGTRWSSRLLSFCYPSHSGHVSYFFFSFLNMILTHFYLRAWWRNRKFQTPKNPSIIPVTWNPEYSLTPWAPVLPLIAMALRPFRPNLAWADAWPPSTYIESPM